MRRRIIAALIVILCCAPQLLANCEECAEYWHWQASTWCKYCRPAYCGYFQCQILDTGPYEYCWGGNAEGNNQCFTPNEGCVAEPVGYRFDDGWRLKDVRVIQPKRAATAVPTVG